MMRRRLLVGLVLLVVVSTAQLLAPALATAAPSHTLTDNSRSFWSLLALVPWAVVAGWGASVVIPYVSAWATAHRSTHWAGLLTAFLALVDGFLATLAQQGHHLDARAALAAAFGSWVIATKWDTKVLAGTSTDNAIHATGLQLGQPGRHEA